MKTLKYLLLALIALLFNSHVFAQEVNSNFSEQNSSYQLKDDDDDCDDDDDDDDDDDNCIIKHPSLFFVTLDPAISDQALDDLQDELNADEIWYRPEINLRLWDTRMFPYVNATGQTVTNIDAQVTSAKDKTDVDGVDFNIGHIVPNQPTGTTGFCFEDIIPRANIGNNPIKISIFDTGITQVAGSFPDYSFTIPQYTGYDYVDDDETPDDLNGHGTHVAGVIHHLLSKAGTPSSISFDIRKTHNALGQGFVSNLIPAILDAVNEGADILNLSFSYQNRNTNPIGRPLKLAIDYAEQMGAMVIAAAGNTNENNDSDAIISFPASYPNENILSVASTSCLNQLSPFSSYGQFSVDVALLGDNIPGPGLSGTINYQSGTSFATANVTAMVATLATHQSTFDYRSIKCSLINTSTTSSDLFEKVVANGSINFPAAFNQLGNGCNTTNLNKTTTSNTIKNQYNIFPNPFKESLNLKTNVKESEEISVSVYTQQGLLVSQKNVQLNDKKTVTLEETSQLKPGIYLVRISTKPGIAETQVVIKM